jgi:hypothetical protein
MIRSFTVALLLSSVFPAYADVIELKTGQRVEGTFKQGTAASISVEVAGQTLTIEVEKVRAIYFGAAPAPVAQQPSARDEAMKALRGLRSVSQAGITYRDYAPRVSDAKILVDRYAAEPDPSPAKVAITDTMAFYVYAASAWNGQISKSYAGLGSNPLIAQCPPLKAKLDEPPIVRMPPDTSMYRDVSVSFHVPIIWSCASDKLAEAEKLLGSGLAAPAAPMAPSVSGPRPAPEWCKAENVVWLGDRCVEKK